MYIIRGQHFKFTVCLILLIIVQCLISKDSKADDKHYIIEQTLTAILAKSAITPHTSIDLQLITRNIGKSSFGIAYDNSLLGYSIIVKDMNGHIYPPKHKYIRSFGSPIYAPVQLSPSQEYSTTYPLSFVYDFINPGIYDITASRDPGNGIPISSNTVKLIVTNRLDPNFILSYHTDKSDYTIHQPINLYLVLNNTSNKGLTFSSLDLFDDISIIIYNTKGEILQPYVHNIKDNIRITNKTLQPGEMMPFTVPISDLYKLDNIGTYFIVAMITIHYNNNDTMHNQVYANSAIVSIKK